MDHNYYYVVNHISKDNFIFCQFFDVVGFTGLNHIQK